MAGKKSQAQREAEKVANIAMVVNHFDSTYGRNEMRLDMWQQLCRDVGIEIGRSIAQCKRNLQGIFINIVDYVNAKKDPYGNGCGFRRFGSPKELSNYIKNNRSKMFPRDEAKKNPILRWMLIHLC